MAASPRAADAPASPAEAPSRPPRPFRIAVCLATHRRPAWLERTLRSIADQRLDGEPPEIRVQVVDNDPDGSGRAVVERMAGSMPWPTSVLVEPEPGISPARNAAFAAVEDWADAIAWIDDDEWAEPTWLAALLRTWDGGRCPVVNGPVVKEPEVEPPAWVRRAGLLEPRRERDGRVIEGFGATGNALVSVAVVRAVSPARDGRAIPFDPALALTGGEDSLLFARLTAAGHPTIWAASAIVREITPPERWSVRWLLRRSLRTGTTLTVVRARLRSKPRWIVQSVADGLAWIVRGSLRTLALPAGRHHAIIGARQVVYGCGLLIGLRGRGHAEYARDAGARP